MRVDRFATYSAMLGVGASFSYNRKFLPGLLLGFTAGTIAGGIQNSREQK